MVAAEISSESANPAPASPRRHRYRSLDSVRGIAAFAVLICHACLVVPSLTQAYVDPNTIRRFSPSWWAAFSPLHLGWAGTEAVYVFFVLSGFVLALPFAAGGTGRSWVGYYPKRFIRLYLPVWAAFALSLAGYLLVPRDFPAGASLWLQSHSDIPLAAAARNDLLLYPGPGISNSALWSLRFEVIFSLFLPLFVLAGRHLPRLNLLKAALLLGAVVAFSQTGLTARFFLPMFGLGTLMAFERSRLAALGGRIRSLGAHRAVWWLLTLTALAMLNSYWTVRGLTTDPHHHSWMIPVSRGLTVVGACLVLFIAIEARSAWLERPTLQWLGKRSYSLFLVHEPIVVSAAMLFGGRPSLPLILGVAVPVSLAVAEAFYRVVEYPSQRLSRLVGDRIDRRVVRSTAVGSGGTRQAEPSMEAS